jgi:uncharacterized protein (TIGR02588 family)
MVSSSFRDYWNLTLGVVAAVAAVLLAFATLLSPGQGGGPQSGFRQHVAPPEFVVEQGRITATDAGHLLAFQVFNRGETDAWDVELIGSVGGETASTTVDRVPARGSARGYLTFKEIPPNAKPRVDVQQYRLPPREP